MRSAGFVLAGGGSTRMGRDKALLKAPDGARLAARAAAAVAKAAGKAVILGDPELYASLGWPVIADLAANVGPIGGLLTALENSTAEWNLLVACDMPGITAELLAGLLRDASGAPGRCVIPVANGEFEPLCAVYHRGALAEVRQAVAEGRLGMRDLAAKLRPLAIGGLDPAHFRNINTPEEWADYRHCP